MSLQAQSARLEAQVIVRDKDGNVKYEGPLILTPILEKADGNDAPDSGTHRNS